VWERVTRVPGDTLAARIAALGPDAPQLPDDAEILVAGCGTGRETALLAMRAPHARITAVDLSRASLAYARSRHAAIDTRNVSFEQRDLREATAEADRYDYISSTGVIHHLPDPEADWACLAHALKPGGVMGLMVYSKIARMRIKAAQYRIADLMKRPVDDDLLREARMRLIADDHPVAHSTDFAALGGVHDLLFNTYEDPFDVARIRAGIERLGLNFLGFHLPGAERRARYRHDNPHDPWFRDYDAWAALELREPGLYAGMYGFWCAKPRADGQ
jgi:SAM-dependent methyltransferase